MAMIKFYPDGSPKEQLCGICIISDRESQTRRLIWLHIGRILSSRRLIWLQTCLVETNATAPSTGLAQEDLCISPGNDGEL